MIFVRSALSLEEIKMGINIDLLPKKKWKRRDTESIYGWLNNFFKSVEEQSPTASFSLIILYSFKFTFLPLIFTLPFLEVMFISPFASILISSLSNLIIDSPFCRKTNLSLPIEIL